MAFRGKEMMNKLMKKIGGEKNLAAGVKEELKRCIPDRKVVMGRAQRGLFAGRHIRFGNQVSEDGGNKHLLRLTNSARILFTSKPQFLFHNNPPPSQQQQLPPNWESTLTHLVNHSMNHVLPVALNEVKRTDVEDQELAFTTLVTADFNEIENGHVFVHASRRSWKPNVQEKRLFSYVLDRHIRVKVTTHALRCIDKAGGIDEYLLRTPYQKMDTEMGLFWKVKIEKLYQELGQMEVVFFSPEDETKFEQGFKDLKIAERDARRDARRRIYGWSGPKLIEEGKADDEEASASGEADVHEQVAVNS
ncbi:hypothetical protein ACFE04_019144 [Oxalis oulophora]